MQEVQEVPEVQEVVVKHGMQEVQELQVLQGVQGGAPHVLAECRVWQGISLRETLLYSFHCDIVDLCH